MTRKIAAKVTIYAQSPKAGAMPFEHERRAEHALDLVLVGLEVVARTRQNQWTPVRGRWVPPADLAESERFGGAVYELAFTFDRGVWVQTWAGDKRPEASLGAIKSRTRVHLNGMEDESSETACGDAEE
jgi:hypothetical protein